MKLKGENIDANVFVQKKISFQNKNEGKVNVNIVKIWEKRLLITNFYEKENISKNGKGANIDAQALMKEKIPLKGKRHGYWCYSFYEKSNKKVQILMV